MLLEHSPDTTVYACLDALACFIIPHRTRMHRDVVIGRGVPFAPAGVYRRVNRKFLAWIVQRIDLALSNPNIKDVARFGQVIMFFYRICDLSDLQPADRVPDDYAKPTAPRPDEFHQVWGKMRCPTVAERRWAGEKIPDRRTDTEED